MQNALRILMFVGMFMFLATPAVGDWDESDGHKMHFPQHPDPDGWDVRVNNARRPAGDPFQWICADDWQCRETGAVRDVHLWVSWMQDMEDQILNLHLSIHEDIPVGPDGWSIPGELLWERDFGPGQFTIRGSGTGDQGWYDPPFEDWWRSDHDRYYQINVTDIRAPFEQQEGTVYWLDVSVDLWGEGETGMLGWKTSLENFRDDAVYWDMPTQRWIELRDPMTGESLDLAFVITPEPSTVAMLLAAALIGLVGRARRRRK